MRIKQHRIPLVIVTSKTRREVEPLRDAIGMNEPFIMVREILTRHESEKILTIGLGDSENDRELLEQVDIPALIPHPERGYLNMDRPGLLRAKAPGSRGWNAVMEGLLDAYAI